MIEALHGCTSLDRFKICSSATGGSIFLYKTRKPKPTKQQVYNDIKMFVIPWAKRSL